MVITTIDTAFRSSKSNESYIFVDEKFELLNCAPGAKKEVILEGPLNVVEGFPMFDNTVFRYGIECSFDTDNNEAFIFSRHECALIDYAPHSKNGTILLGPISITAMFPCLKGTALETGITAAIRSAGNMVFLFKGDEYARIDFKTKKLMSNVYIRNGFQSLVGTVFEYGFDAAFSSHVKDEAYIFKGEYYACINYAPSTTSGDFIVTGRIRRIKDDWPALHGLLKL